ncbi:hypothetical protein IGB42_01460 [Andreprevotia sp. IGB-42]|uniref:COG4648 family protein n=1 Tax=Andreprevotia sp. IGB-42 TaxID=2497473 RepID=UPI001359BCE4|nr:hypothetical protein [Andreprevotia sp. IGB-42]KAF0813781.1 hypothetical protein IGB42_01460 [Andreprevotia sp. IGB-42]
MNRLLGIAAGLLLPLFFWLCHWQGWPFWTGGLLLVPLAFVRARRAGLVGTRSGRWLGVAAALLGVAALASRSSLPLTFYPVLVNVVLLVAFAASLTGQQSMIERLARLGTPDLPPSGVVYTRKVTMVWCGFFALNGTIALWTTTQPEAVWARYNGLIAYLAMGTLFACEYTVRLIVMRRNREANDA